MIDLSKVTKLKDAAFGPGLWDVEWITMTLQTIAPAHRDLRQISIYIPYRSDDLGRHFTQTIEEAILRQWLALDRLLVQLWESHSIRPRVAHLKSEEEEENEWMRECIEGLLPEMTGRGIIELAEFT